MLHNPAWKMYKPQGEKKESPVADEELVQSLITALEGQSLKYETYFKLVLATGMRRGEACGLRWSDINWKRRSIHVQRNVVKLSHEPIFVKPPKTASGDRVVYVSKEMAKVLLNPGNSNARGIETKTMRYYRKMTTCSASRTATRWCRPPSHSASRRSCARAACRKI